jgi:hypothetical protein
MKRILAPNGKRRRLTQLGVIASAVMLLALILVPSAMAVLPGSPSKFESGNDPTTGLGNMTVNTAGNTDWVSVTGNSAYVHLTDVSNSNGDDSFTPGQKQDTTCPTIETHKNPPKDDFTDVASFVEGGQADPTFLYGATLRYAANGNASENIELNQGTSGECVPGFLARTPGDKLIAIDYLGGGSAVQFHVLTWIATGACFVSKDVAPCWGASVLTLDPNVAEGGVNTTNITAANNPISGKAIVAGQFAEFGVNLAGAGIITPGSCKSFSQTVWESRSSGSSFVSSTKDISIETKDINTCASVSVRKVGSDGGSQEGAVFSLYQPDDTGTLIGTCTVDSNGDCTPSFTGLTPGDYTLYETGTPAGYNTDPTLPYAFTLAVGDSLELEFTDPVQAGALSILKNSSKGGAVANDGAVFSYGTGLSVTDNGAGDEDSATGSVCVSGLTPGDYTVNETSPPDGYGASTGEADQVVTVADGTNCTDSLPGTGATATFTNPPLSDIQVNFRDGGSGETSALISCDNASGTSDTTAATGWDTSNTVTGVEGATTITCTITIDP